MQPEPKITFPIPPDVWGKIELVVIPLADPTKVAVVDIVHSTVEIWSESDEIKEEVKHVHS